MKYGSLAALFAILLASCAGSDTAATSYAPRMTNPQAVRLGTNTLLLSTEHDTRDNTLRGYAPGSGGADTFFEYFTVCPGFAEDHEVYDSASDPHGQLYVLGARPVESGGNDIDTCPSAFINIWFQPRSGVDADYAIGYSEHRLSHHAHSIAIDSVGKIYVGDLHDVVIFAAFVHSKTPFDDRPIGSIQTDFAEIASVRLDRYNNVYVLGTNHRIEEFAAGSRGSATPIRTLTVPNGISQPGSIAIARSGEIYTLAGGNDSVPNSTRVLVYPASGGSSPIRQIAGSKTGLFSSTALAVCADGTLYVGGGGVIRVFAPGSSSNVPATVVWRRRGGIPVRSLNW